MAVPRKSFSTKKGSELPILNLRGKEYLQVAHRLVWFREENPNGIIKTEILSMGGEGNDAFCVTKAEILIDTGRGMQIVATAHKRETKGDFADYVEKAETSAIGRALAMAGYGTQFTADELDEGERLADAPLETVTKSTATTGDTTTRSRTSFRQRVEKQLGKTAGDGNGAATDDI